MSLKRLTVPRMRRWSAGQFVDSAARLNQPIDAIEALKDTLGNAPQATNVVEEFLFVTSVETAPAELGKCLCSRRADLSDPFKVSIWPGLYPATDYTYSDNNTRTHTPSSTQEVLTPELAVGDVLHCKFVYHPTLQVIAWVDFNATARQWAEVPGS